MSATPKVVVRVVLIAALIIPIVFYTFEVVARRSEEVRRYHQEMVALEKELRHSLEALGDIVISASRLNKDRSVPDLEQAGELLSQDRVTLKRSVVWVASEAQAPISNCIIQWETNVERLLLHFKADWPISAANETDDVRLRFSGDIDIGKVLAQSGRVTNFDALLVADERGDLVQKFGPDADYFSALPSFNEAELKDSSEDRDKAALFLPVAKTINREIAGRNFKIFPRNLVLRPLALEGDPLYCRAEPGQGQEIVRLRIVGLVKADRLATLAIRPSETVYWCGVFYYALITFLFIELKRPVRAKTLWWPRPATGSSYFRSLTGWIAAIGFALTLGIFVAAGWMIYSHHERIDRHLQLVLQESFFKTSARIANIRKTFERPWNEHWCQGLARCADIDRDGWMTKYAFGSTELQPRNVTTRGYFEKTNGTNKVVIEPVVSRASGLREIVVAKGMGKSGAYSISQEPSAVTVRSVTSSLIHFGEQQYPAQFGLAFAEVDGGRWNVFFSSEPYRQASQNFLQQFSDTDCLRIEAQNPEGGFCSGLLYGRPARVLVRPASGFGQSRRSPVATEPPKAAVLSSTEQEQEQQQQQQQQQPDSSAETPQQQDSGTETTEQQEGAEDSCHDIGCASESGKVLLISYFFEDLYEARLSATLRATLKSGLLVLTVLSLGIFLTASAARRGLSLPRPSAWRRIARRLDFWLDSNLWYRASLIRICVLVLAFTVGLGLLLASWAIEDHWQHRLSASTFVKNCQSIADRCRAAYEADRTEIKKALIASCQRIEKNYLVALNETRENDGQNVFGMLAIETYQELRPTHGRYSEVIPAFDDSLAVAEGRLFQEAWGRPHKKSSLGALATGRRFWPADATIHFLSRIVLAAGILVLFLWKPNWLRSVLAGHTLSTSAIVTVAALGLLLVIFKHELMAAVIALLGTFEKVHETFDRVTARLLK